MKHFFDLNTGPDAFKLFLASGKGEMSVGESKHYRVISVSNGRSLIGAIRTKVKGQEIESERFYQRGVLDIKGAHHA